MIGVASLVLGSCLVTPVSAEPYLRWVILHGDGYRPNLFGFPGMEKSYI